MRKNMLTLDNIYTAANLLNEAIRRTDIVAAPRLCPGVDLYLKTENLQTTGSFKLRGAYYKMSKLTDVERARGVIACSAGNHGQGVALAATRYGIKSVICLPDHAPTSKINATKRYGGELCLVPGGYDDAYEKALSLCREHNYTFIHPFDDKDVIAGQGTVALEILDQLSKIDAVVLPIGGGGLAAGISFVIKNVDPRIKIIGVQADGAPSMLDSIRKGKPTELDYARTIADGIAVKKPGRIAFDICSRYLDDIVTVSDDEISTAILSLMERHKLVTEGAGAASVAAIMFEKINLMGKRAVAILSGGNIDLKALANVINKGIKDK